jgi:hypothetical protein
MWLVVAIIATTVSVIAWTTLPAWPIVGVAVATLVLAVNTISSKLQADACLGCGQSLAGQPRGEHGAICPSCGLVNQPQPMTLAKMDAQRTLDVMQASQVDEQPKA